MPPEVLSTVVPARVTAPSVIAVAVVFTVVLVVVVLFVDVSPPVNVIGLPANVTPPVFEKVVAGVTVPPPLKMTPYPTFAVLNAAATVTAPLNVMLPVVFVSVTVGDTVVPLIVVPPLLVTVNELILSEASVEVPAPELIDKL